MRKPVFGSAPYPARSHDFLEAIKEAELEFQLRRGFGARTPGSRRYGQQT